MELLYHSDSFVVVRFDVPPAGAETITIPVSFTSRDGVRIAAEVVVGGEDLGNGRLVLLHDPAGNPSWDGDFRCVTYARAEVDAEMVADPLLTEVGWSWLTDALERYDAAYTAPSGTVTAVSSRAFGAMSADPSRAEVEIRASWTPVVTSAGTAMAAQPPRNAWMPAAARFTSSWSRVPMPRARSA